MLKNWKSKGSTTVFFQKRCETIVKKQEEPAPVNNIDGPKIGPSLDKPNNAQVVGLATAEAERHRELILFSDTESESDYSEYESDHEPVEQSPIMRDWQGNIVEFNRDCPFYPISASEFSHNILKRYRNNRRVAFEKTGYRLPLTMANIKGQRGRIHKNASTISDKKGKIVFP